MSTEQKFDQYQSEFLEQLPEQLDAIESFLIDLEKESDQNFSVQLARSILASLHSVKGACGIYELRQKSQLLHAAEDIIIRMNGKAGVQCKPEIQSCLELLDKVRTSEGLEPNKAPAATAKIIPFKNQHLAKVLLVEPSKTISKILYSYLSERNLEVTLCRTDLEAIQQISTGQKFDFFISSQKLQKFTGLSLIALIKLSSEDTQVKTILMSSDLKSFKSSNISPDLLIAKNENSYEKIFQFIREHLPRLDQQQRNVFFVDDQDEIHMVAKLIFKNIPELKVSYFTASTLALTAAIENPPDILITDFQMPIINGQQLLKKFKEACPNAKTQFFLLSGETKVDFIKKQLELGFSGAIDKTGAFKTELKKIFAA